MWNMGQPIEYPLLTISNVLLWALYISGKVLGKFGPEQMGPGAQLSGV